MFRNLILIVIVSSILACNQSPEMKTNTGFITVADSKLYYESTGQGEAIVLIHGGFLDRRMWDKQVKEFSKDYRVITCDLRGHGATTDGDSSYFMHEAVRMLLDTLQVKKVTIAGLSLGAIIATDFAIEYPQYTNKLVLVTPGLNKMDTSFAEDTIMNSYSRLIMKAIETDRDIVMAAEYFIRSWFDGPYREASETDTTERRKALAMAMSTLKNHNLLLHWPRFAEPPAIGRLKNISSPTLIIVTDKDNYRISKHAEVLKADIPRSKITIINNVAHMPNMEKPAEFNRIFLEFLKGE